ncbi:hypothetical protein ANAEL_00686 [Anaerolineales bacterium]|nr:hypothetical protein ANAEL_00686 [Anaerolineales bacterium]
MRPIQIPWLGLIIGQVHLLRSCVSLKNAMSNVSVDHAGSRVDNDFVSTKG